MEYINTRFQIYTFSLVMLEEAELPANKTSMFRGGIGEMLLRKHCFADRKCEDCGFRETCIVPNIFYHGFKIKPGFAQGKESEGYIIDCSDLREHYETGDLLEFSITLLGDVIVFFSTIMDAVYMLGQIGVGVNTVRYEVVGIRNQNGNIVMKDNQVYLNNAAPQNLNWYVSKRLKEFDVSEESSDIYLKMLSPCSMKSKGEYIFEFDRDALINSIYRRIYILSCFEGNEVPQYYDSGIPLEILEQKSRKVTVSRYSSTHGKKLYLNGFVGEADIRVRNDFLPYLIAGEILHVGKNTSMGFGKFLITN